MAGYTDFYENAVQNYLFRGVAMPALTDLFFALFKTIPGEDGTGGTEVTETGYARSQVARSTGNWKDPSTATQGQCLNLVKIVWPVMNQAVAAAVVGIGAYDASASGNLLFTIDTNDITVDALGQPYIEINGMTVGLD